MEMAAAKRGRVRPGLTQPPSLGHPAEGSGPQLGKAFKAPLPKSVLWKGWAWDYPVLDQPFPLEQPDTSLYHATKNNRLSTLASWIQHHQAPGPEVAKNQGVHRLPCVAPVCPGSHTNPPQAVKWGFLGEFAQSPGQSSLLFLIFFNRFGSSWEPCLPKTTKYGLTFICKSPIYLPNIDKICMYS